VQDLNPVFSINQRNKFADFGGRYALFPIGTKEKAAALRQWLCARADYGYLFDAAQPDHFRYAVLQFVSTAAVRSP